MTDRRVGDGYAPKTEVIKVIKIQTTVGEGVGNDPHRHIVWYFTVDGELLAYKDQWAEDAMLEEAANE